MYGNGRRAIDDWQEFLLNLQAYLIVGALGVIVAVLCLVYAPALRRRLLPIPRLRPGRWRGSEVLLAVLTWRFVVPFVILLILVAVGASLPRDDVAEQLRLQIYISPLNVALTLALVITHLFVRSRTRPHHFGLTWTRWPANVVLGIATFLIATPIILTVYYVVTQLFITQPHPVEQAVRTGFPDWGWPLLIFMTVIGAPLIEETVFRGILQGWLRRASFIGHCVLMIAVLIVGATPLITYFSAQAAEGKDKELFDRLAPASALDAIPPLVFAVVLVAGYGTWLWLLWSRYLRDRGSVWLWRPEKPWLAPAGPAEDPDEESDAEDEEAGPPPLRVPDWPRDPVEVPQQRDWAWANARLSIYGSAMMFAMAHETWPTPVPLFLLGLALGWLAYRTQSLVGTIACHGLFNAVATIVLYWSTWVAP